MSGRLGHYWATVVTADGAARIVTMDEIADFADRARGMSEFEFEIEWLALTADEREDFLVLMDQRRAQRTEKLEALQENVRILSARRDLIVASGAPAGMGLGEALVTGHIDVLKVVESMRDAVPNPEMD